MQLSEKLKTLSQFYPLFLTSSSNFEHFEKKMAFIANVFPTLETLKDMVRLMFG